jgi:HEAT repeat protein
MAVCRAFIQTRSSTKSVKNEEDFIQPLLGIFDTEIAAEIQLAAEATRAFEYEKIGESLVEIVTDASKPVKTRMNAIYALKLRPDMDATIKLIELVDDPEEQIAAEAEKALHSLAIPVGRDADMRRRNIRELRDKGKDVFLRDWLIRQETQMREIRAELDSWQESYLAVLGKTYKGISDDAVKGSFLAEYLRSPKAAVKLWALEKVYEWRVASGASKLPAELGPILIDLIKDQDKDVRLKTAELLQLLQELNSASRLLAQLEAEQDDQVKTQLLVALGGACSYAISANPPVKISPEMRKQALEWAAKFLSEKDAKKAQTGAQVIKKLLERDGLEPQEVDAYLRLLAERYNPPENKPDGALRGELLSAMAGLCAQNSTCKAKAAERFGPLFDKALEDETDFVRETAVDGLANIDKPSALERLRNGFVNDPSVILRKKLIALAGESGGKDDLTWLAEKIGSNSESEPAWQAMLEIFKDMFKDPDASVLKVLNEWAEKLTLQSSKLSNEQKNAFLTAAEKRADDESKPRIRKKLLEVYLAWPKPELAANLVASALEKEDLDGSNFLLQTIDDYLGKPAPGTDPSAVFGALSGIKPSQGRPKWELWLKARLQKDEKPDQPKQPSE